MKFVQKRGGNEYFITFVDDVEKFVPYKHEVENKLNKKIKVLRNDRGGEYESPFVDVYAQHMIIHETTTPYSSQSNGVAE